jgi:hypothetical protein
MSSSYLYFFILILILILILFIFIAIIIVKVTPTCAVCMLACRYICSCMLHPVCLLVSHMLP